MKKLFSIALLCFLAISMQAQNGGTKFPVKNYQEFVNIRNKNANGKLLEKGVYKAYKDITKKEAHFIFEIQYIEIWENYAYVFDLSEEKHRLYMDGAIMELNTSVPHDIERTYSCLYEDDWLGGIVFKSLEYNFHDKEIVFIKSTEIAPMISYYDYIGVLVEEGAEYSSTSKSRTIPAGYVDLGLPSGTLWKDKNEEGGLYTYDKAVAKFGSSLPTKEQLEELKNSCSWSWTGSGYKVTGPSGASIILPAAGYRDCSGSVYLVGSNGYYWSSTPNGSDRAWDLGFNSIEVRMRNYDRCIGRSVRLVR